MWKKKKKEFTHKGMLEMASDLEISQALKSFLPNFQTFQNGSLVHCLHITKTYLYNFDPLKPHFYIVKLGFTGVYIIFLISAQNIDFGCSLEPPEYPQSMFCAEI